MNPFSGRPFLFPGLVIYTLLLTGVMLYIRFPYDEFKQYCEHRLTELIPGTVCSIDAIRFTLPPAIEMETVQFTEESNKANMLFTITHGALKPSLQAPFSRSQITVSAYQGTLESSITRDKTKQTMHFDRISLDRLNLAEVPFLEQTFKRKITGFLSGNATIRTTLNGHLHIHSGQGEVTIEDGSFSLIYPVLSLKEIDLKKLTADFSLSKSELRLQQGSFEGKDLQGDFQGGCTLPSPLRNAELVIEGSLEPRPTLLKQSKYVKNMVLQLKKQNRKVTLPFLIDGNVQQPRFKFDS